MRKFLLAMVLLLGAAGTFFVLSGGPQSKAPIGLMMNAETREIARQSQRFMEAIQFKDFKAAADFSSPEDRDKADIPKLIERLFQVKPELLDINKIELLDASVDSTGKRARAKLGTDVKLLNTNELRHPEIMLYWKKGPKGEWFTDLASSLQ